MPCPPGYFTNPYTLRCVQATGKVGRELYERGYVSPGELQYAVAAATAYGYKQRTYRKPRITVVKDCEPGYIRSSKTRKCIKIGGKAYQELNPAGNTVVGRAFAPVPLAPVPLAPAPVPLAPVPLAPPLQKLTILPLGSSGTAPMTSKEHILDWTKRNCKFTNNLLTGNIFADDTQENLQRLVRLHDGSCMSAPALHNHITEQTKAGAIATLPHDPSSHLTVGDFDALREVQRRVNPAYKIPQTKHRPPPPEWELFATPEGDFVRLLYVDKTKAIPTATGPSYPQSSIRVDLGVLPNDGTLHTLLDAVKRQAAANKLLTPTAGGWKPTLGFPYAKSYWSRDRKTRVQKLYISLQK